MDNGIKTVGRHTLDVMPDIPSGIVTSAKTTTTSDLR